MNKLQKATVVSEIFMINEIKRLIDSNYMYYKADSQLPFAVSTDGIFKSEKDEYILCHNNTVVFLGYAKSMEEWDDFIRCDFDFSKLKNIYKFLV